MPSIASLFIDIGLRTMPTSIPKALGDLRTSVNNLADRFKNLGKQISDSDKALDDFGSKAVQKQVSVDTLYKSIDSLNNLVSQFSTNISDVNTIIAQMVREFTQSIFQASIFNVQLRNLSTTIQELVKNQNISIKPNLDLSDIIDNLLAFRTALGQMEGLALPFMADVDMTGIINQIKQAPIPINLDPTPAIASLQQALQNMIIPRLNISNIVIDPASLSNYYERIGVSPGLEVKVGRLKFRGFLLWNARKKIEKDLSEAVVTLSSVTLPVVGYDFDTPKVVGSWLSYRSGRNYNLPIIGYDFDTPKMVGSWLSFRSGLNYSIPISGFTFRPSALQSIQTFLDSLQLNPLNVTAQISSIDVSRVPEVSLTAQISSVDTSQIPTEINIIEGILRVTQLMDDIPEAMKTIDAVLDVKGFGGMMWNQSQMMAQLRVKLNVASFGGMIRTEGGAGAQMDVALNVKSISGVPSETEVLPPTIVGRGGRSEETLTRRVVEWAREKVAEARPTQEIKIENNFNITAEHISDSQLVDRLKKLISEEVLTILQAHGFGGI